MASLSTESYALYANVIRIFISIKKSPQERITESSHEGHCNATTCLSYLCLLFLKFISFFRSNQLLECYLGIESFLNC